MKRKAILLALVAVILASSVVLAAPTALQLPRSVFSGGGARVAAGSYALDGTIGQAIVGEVSMGGYRVCSGFWCGLGIYKILLPIIFK
jgi:hypothetical protein